MISRRCRFSITGKRWVPQGIYIDESSKEHRLVYLHDWEKFCRLFAREQELLKRAPAGSENERSKLADLGRQRRITAILAQRK